MQGRPPSSPRPTTAFNRDQFQQGLRQQSYDMEEEESDEESVFAFLPPSTADPKQHTCCQQVQYPEPVFNPLDRQYPIPPPVPPAAPFPVDSTSPSISPPSRVHYSLPGINGVSPSTNSRLYPCTLPPSPSTDSRPSTEMASPDLYRLRRLGTALSSKLGVVDVKETEEPRPLSPSAKSSVFQHGLDPSHSHSQPISHSQTQMYHPHYRQQHAGMEIPQTAKSLADSLNFTQSMMEDNESQSIK